MKGSKDRGCCKVQIVMFVKFVILHIQIKLTGLDLTSSCLPFLMLLQTAMCHTNVFIFVFVLGFIGIYHCTFVINGEKQKGVDQKLN